MSSYRDVETWSADHLDQLPPAETDQFEFKSGKSNLTDLRAKVADAASAFWNSGGGYFIAGVGGDGVPDGGIPLLVGRQSIRDWLDQAIAQVEPPGPYGVGSVTATKRGTIAADRCVVVVGFGRSSVVPHMSADRRYYVRAGAHSVSIGHYLVEALRTYRAFETPQLECLLRYVTVSRGTGVAVELAIVAANRSPALDVHIDIETVPGYQAGVSRTVFPKRVPLISLDAPYTMRVTGAQAFHDAVFNLKLRFKDVAGLDHESTSRISGKEQLGAAIY